MRQVLLRLWDDDGGALIAMEWVFVATILVMGAITGLVAVRQAVLAELSDIATTLLSFNQGYSFSGQSNCESSTAGSQFNDSLDSIPATSTVAPLPNNYNLRACD